MSHCTSIRPRPDIYEIDDRKEGWTLEHVECPHPKAMRFPDEHPAARCLRCAWADWLTFPEVETPAPPTPPAYHARKERD